jgi:hypothetical protein
MQISEAKLPEGIKALISKDKSGQWKPIPRKEKGHESESTMGRNC